MTINETVDALGAWFVAADKKLQGWLYLPAWVSVIGLLEHAVVGQLFAWLLGPVCSGWGVLFIVAILALVHEQAQGNFSDFRRPKPGEPENGAPWNGILDVAAFMIGIFLP